MKLNRKNTRKAKGKSSGNLARDLAEHAPPPSTLHMVEAPPEIIRLAPPARRNSPGTPQFPTIGAGEWVHVMHQQEPPVEIVLPFGAFVWLWDVVELRSMKWQQGLEHGMSKEFTETYEPAVYGAVEAMRRAAAHHFPIVRDPDPPVEKPKPEPKKKSSKKKKSKGLRFHTS